MLRKVLSEPLVTPPGILQVSPRETLEVTPEALGLDENSGTSDAKTFGTLVAGVFGVASVSNVPPVVHLGQAYSDDPGGVACIGTALNSKCVAPSTEFIV
jgi:hypothetical protein